MFAFHGLIMAQLVGLGSLHSNRKQLINSSFIIPMKRRQFIQTSLCSTGATLLIDRFSQTTIAENAPRKIALLIGVNDYSHGNTKNVPSLKGCINDVALLQNLLIYRYRFESKNIITLTNAQATRNNILNTIETHLLTANPNDIVVFSFSGHGAPLNDPYEKGNLSKTTGIIPYDHIIQPDGDRKSVV